MLEDADGMLLADVDCILCMSEFCVRLSLNLLMAVYLGVIQGSYSYDGGREVVGGRLTP